MNCLLGWNLERAIQFTVNFAVTRVSIELSAYKINSQQLSFKLSFKRVHDFKLKLTNNRRDPWTKFRIELSCLRPSTFSWLVNQVDSTFTMCAQFMSIWNVLFGSPFATGLAKNLKLRTEQFRTVPNQKQRKIETPTLASVDTWSLGMIWREIPVGNKSFHRRIDSWFFSLLSVSKWKFCISYVFVK